METLESLSQRIGTTEDIHAIVRTMKSLSAVSIRQYERAMEALADYERTVDLGLNAVLREDPARFRSAQQPEGPTVAIVFGSDRGLCGRFNERLADLVLREQAQEAADGGGPALMLVVGALAAARLEALGRPADEVYFLPGSAAGLTRTAQSILVRVDHWRETRGVGCIRVFHNRRDGDGGAIAPVSRRLLPLSPEFLDARAGRPWPARGLPVYRMAPDRLFSWLLREHLLVTLIRAGADSLASEHAARLAAMTGADRSIEERLDTLSAQFRRMRQDAITTELLDIVSGVEAMRTAPEDGGEGA
jgi:F-type H+-transporting ATPase subunit gamma